MWIWVKIQCYLQYIYKENVLQEVLIMTKAMFAYFTSRQGQEELMQMSQP